MKIFQKIILSILLSVSFAHANIPTYLSVTHANDAAHQKIAQKVSGYMQAVVNQDRENTYAHFYLNDQALVRYCLYIYPKSTDIFKHHRALEKALVGTDVTVELETECHQN
jgi:hypothetical protein